jgi:predicted Zn-dependent protease with MMP-like domain
MPNAMDRLLFERIVNETIATLPAQFRTAIADVPIVIQPYARNRRERSLLGLYEGLPLTQWGRNSFSGKLPDTITLFQENIEAYATSPEEIPHIIRETLLHEIAHHFGFDHDKIG